MKMMVNVSNKNESLAKVLIFTGLYKASNFVSISTIP